MPLFRGPVNRRGGHSRCDESLERGGGIPPRGLLYSACKVVELLLVTFAQRSRNGAGRHPGALQHSEERVVISRGDGIELVVMASRAAQCQAQKRLTDDIDLVIDSLGLIVTEIDRRVLAGA